MMFDDVYRSNFHIGHICNKTYLIPRIPLLQYV
nr:MAG TPA: hypothetical protein [Caudoviricetes sp.]